MAIGKFDVLGPLGQGAGSTVLKVRRHSDGKIYALKVVKVQSADDLKFVEQVEHEYAVSRAFAHPHLCKIHELEVEKNFLGKVQGAKLLVEYVDGKPLIELTQMSLGKLLVVFAKTAAALAHMHAVGVYHADVKPDNIMVTAAGDVRLIDFGVAWLRGDDKGRIQGTLDYLAPEQARKKIANAKTDVYNLGATMYRMLAGCAVPLAMIQKGSSKFGRVDDLIRPIVDLNPHVPEAVDSLVRKCLRFHPGDRPESMKEVFRALKDIAERRQEEKRKKRGESA